MKLAFLGTPAFALPTLTACIEAGHEIAAVYTRAPKPAGRRGLALTPSPVHALAESRSLPVRTPTSLRDRVEQAAFAALDLDVAVVVGYGLLLPPPILAAPRAGCLNLHPSILPRWRGAAPIQRPIMAGDTETAAAIMVMEEGLDTGPVALERRVPIPPDATAGDMHDRLAALGALLMVEALRHIGAGTLAPRPQAADGVVYAAKIDKAEARIDWSRPAREVHDRIRGLSPLPGAFFEADLGRGRERVKILKAEYSDAGIRSFDIDSSALDGPPGSVVGHHLLVKCGQGFLQLAKLQRAGKSAVPVMKFLEGTKVPFGTVLF